MDDAARKEFKERHRDLSDARIREEVEKYTVVSVERKILRRILEERREAADAGEKERHQQTFAQRERHHRASVISAWVAAVISLLGALAAWASVWCSYRPR
jgi:hypothetical protein